MEWNDNLESFGLILTDGSSCKVGENYFTNSHIFDPTKKITKIEVIISKDECHIIRINFYSVKELLVKVGLADDYVKKNGGRGETVEIAADEQLIGAELDGS